jgi:ABC-type glycerol-3-phosphate transport system substrate-binding protein
LTACTTAAPTTAPGGATTAPPAEKVQMSFWMNFNFVEAVNETIRNQVQTWADANNVEIDILIDADANLQPKWAAGLEAPDTMPDVSVVFQQWFGRFYDAGLLLDVSDAFNASNSVGGGFFPAAASLVTVGGQQYGVPYIGSVTPAYFRTDKLAEAGLSEPPATYEELLDFCKQVNIPGEFWCYGFGLGGFSDNDVQMRNILWSYGAKIVEEDGVTLALDSAETRAALTWIKELWDSGSVPPDALVGDDASNNNWYQTGVVATIVNTGSVLAYLRDNDPDLLANTILVPSPAGPAGTHASGGFGSVLGAFNTTEHPELANSLIAYFTHPDQVWARTVAANFGNLPVHVDAANDPAWDDPYLKPFIQQLAFARPQGWPGPATTAASEVTNRLVLPRMAIRLVTGEQTIDQTIAQAMQELEEIYTEFPPSAGQ